MNATEQPRDITNVALGFELGLAGVALGIGLVIGHLPYERTDAFVDYPFSDLKALLWGLIATAPMLLMFYITYRFPIGPLRKLRRVVEELLVPLFAKASLLQLALISLAAGVGEELLFRGLLQSALTEQFEGEQRWLWPLVIASVGFGICHWITTAYAVLAALIGVYLGLLYLRTGNIVAPILAHALYDFVALVFLVKIRSAGKKKSGLTESDQAADSFPDQDIP